MREKEGEYETGARDKQARNSEKTVREGQVRGRGDERQLEASERGGKREREPSERSRWEAVQERRVERKGTRSSERKAERQ